jgi:hypothetical protein
MRGQSERVRRPQNLILSAENASKGPILHTRERRTACLQRRRHREVKKTKIIANAGIEITILLCYKLLSLIGVLSVVTSILYLCIRDKVLLLSDSSYFPPKFLPYLLQNSARSFPCADLCIDKFEHDGRKR